MIERVIRNVTYDISKNGEGLVLRVITAYCESSMASGSICRTSETYERLTPDELGTVLEELAWGPTAGEPFVMREHQLTLI